MPSTVYRNHPAISRSQLSDLNRSPLHYWARHVDPDRIIAEKYSPALKFGTAVHMAVLEPALFMQTYAEGPMAARSTRGLERCRRGVRLRAVATRRVPRHPGHRQVAVFPPIRF